MLAVAEQLGSLTAAGTRGLSPEQAIAALVPRAGTEFDPHVVAAARWAVEEDVLVSTRSAANRAAASATGWSWSPTSRSNPLHTNPISRDTSSARSAFGFCDHQVASASAPPAMISASCSSSLRSRPEPRRARVAREQVGERARRAAAQLALVVGDLGVADVQRQHRPGVAGLGHERQEGVDAALEALLDRRPRPRSPARAARSKISALRSTAARYSSAFVRKCW